MDYTPYVHRVKAGEDMHAVAAEAGILPGSLRAMVERDTERAAMRRERRVRAGRPPGERGPNPRRVARDAEMLERAQSGVPVHQLAADYRISALSVRSRLRVMGWRPERRPRVPTATDEEHAAEVQRTKAERVAARQQRNERIAERLKSGEDRRVLAGEYDLDVLTVENIGRSLGYEKRTGDAVRRRTRSRRRRSPSGESRVLTTATPTS
jgi:hypothetical protein